MRYFLERENIRKRVCWNRGLRPSVHVVLRFQENFMQNLSAFLLFFGNKKSCKSSIFFHSLVSEFLSFFSYWLKFLWLIFEEKINTKTIVNLSRENHSLYQGETISHFMTQVIFSSNITHTFDKSSPSKCKFLDFSLLALKFTKFLISFFKQKVTFSSKFG